MRKKAILTLTVCSVALAGYQAVAAFGPGAGLEAEGWGIGRGLDAAPALAIGAHGGPPAAAAGEVAEMSAAAPAVDPFFVDAAARAAHAERVDRRAASVPADVDLSALAYFRETGQDAYAEAELARIRARHPGFSLPADFGADPAIRDEGPIWDRLAAGDRRAARAEIERRRDQHPGWRPSARLAEALADAEARARLAAAAREGRWRAVLSAAAARPAVATCADPSALWWIGEAFVRTGAEERALDVYAYVLATCEDAATRRATLDAAIGVLPEAERARLEALAALTEADRGHLARRALGRARAAVAAANDDPARPAGGEALALVELSARRGSAADMRLLGWHHYAEKRFDAAETWFSRALGDGFEEEAMVGLLNAIRRTGDHARARDLAARHYRGSGPVTDIYIELLSMYLLETRDPKEDAAEVALLGELVAERRSAFGAETVGWKILSKERPREALDWFERSLGWETTEGAVLGIAIASHLLGDAARVERIAGRWGPRFPDLKTHLDAIAAGAGDADGAAGLAEATAVLRTVLAAYHARRYEAALAALDRRRDLVGETRDLTILRAWSLHNMGRSRDAYALFAALDGDLSTRETRKGMLHTWRSFMPPRFH